MELCFFPPLCLVVVVMIFVFFIGQISGVNPRTVIIFIFLYQVYLMTDIKYDPDLDSIQIIQVTHPIIKDLYKSLLGPTET